MINACSENLAALVCVDICSMIMIMMIHYEMLKVGIHYILFTLCGYLAMIQHSGYLFELLLCHKNDKIAPKMQHSTRECSVFGLC